MKLSMLNAEACQTLLVEGRIDATNAHQLKERVLAQLDLGQMNFLLDMTAVDFVDSSGLGAMVTCLRGAQKKKGRFKICGLQPRVRELFEMTRLDRVFELYENRADAMKTYV